MSSKQKQRRPSSPISLRVTHEERQELALAAKARKKTVSDYIRDRIFGERPAETSSPPTTPGTRISRMERQRLLARILHSLGSLDAVRNLTDLAAAARLGVLPLTPETVNELKAACDAIHEIRSRLVAALGGRARRDE